MLTQALHGAARMLRRDGSAAKEKQADEIRKAVDDWGSSKGLTAGQGLSGSAIPEEHSSELGMEFAQTHLRMTAFPAGQVTCLHAGDLLDAFCIDCQMCNVCNVVWCHCVVLTGQPGMPLPFTCCSDHASGARCVCCHLAGLTKHCSKQQPGRKRVPAVQWAACARRHCVRLPACFHAHHELNSV